MAAIPSSSNSIKSSIYRSHFFRLPRREKRFKNELIKLLIIVVLDLVKILTAQKRKKNAQLM